MPSARRASAILASAALMLALAPTAARATDRTITLVGDLQDELGCASDWDPGCTASQLVATGPMTYQSTFQVPAGSYSFKVAANGSWDENYGAGGVANGANIPLALAGPAALQFTFDDDSHVVSVAPTDLPDDTVTAADEALAQHSLRADLTKERFYFVMTDRFANGSKANDNGGLTGDRLDTGYDPTNVGFYHGGDLRGIMDKLDYIKGLGTTSIWLTPSFKNRPVQGSGDQASAGYHGYWITDFTQIDPHLGTNDEMKQLISKAHAKGMKVFFDIITNHTADIIDNEQGQYGYISKEAVPYKDADGKVFDDTDYVNSPDFPQLNANSFPYTPKFRTPQDANAKSPAWLNDVTLYHNRGDSTFAGESSTYGDFVGLDDLFTEHPKVESGMEEIYNAWVDLGIDGFRIDTVKHVNTGFWTKFSPAVLAHAGTIGNSDFFMFGEVFDSNPAYVSTFTKEGKLQAALDFGFQDRAVAVAKGADTTSLAALFAKDDYYTDADSNAYQLPTFLGNHDMGRVASFIPGTEDERLQRDLFAHSLMYTLRGQPVVYYGDEQGFTGNGGDKAARQDMFASQSAQYNADIVLGGPEGSMDRFNRNAPLYKHISRLASLRAAHPALADGTQINRYSSDTAGIFAVSRIDRPRKTEYLVVANNDTTPHSASFTTASKNAKFRSIHGGGRDLRADQQGTVKVHVPALSVRVFKADRVIGAPTGGVSAGFVTPQLGSVVGGNAEIRVAVPSTNPVEVTFAYRPVGTSQWQLLGTDDNAPYRVFQDVTPIASNTMVEYRAVVRDTAGHLTARSSWATVGEPPAPPAGPGVGDVAQPSQVSVPGNLNSEMGCPGDWDPACAQAQLTLDPRDNIWKGSYTLPESSYEYKAALNGSWDENYGANAVRNGGNIPLGVSAATKQPVKFYYDNRTHFVTSSAAGPLPVAVGDFQSDMTYQSGTGCSDWDPGCLRSWLQDIDGNGVYTLATTQVPAGTWSVKVALDEGWDVNYGADGVPGGANIPFTVPTEGSVTTFAWDATTHRLAISVEPPPATPDLGVDDAYWLDSNTLAYPSSRLPAGTDPSWLRFRLHWGQLSLGPTSLGGCSVLLTTVPGAPEGYLALRLPRGLRQPSPSIGQAIGVYNDADALVDATGVKPRTS